MSCSTKLSHYAGTGREAASRWVVAYDDFLVQVLPQATLKTVIGEHKARHDSSERMSHMQLHVVTCVLLANLILLLVGSGTVEHTWQ